MEFEYGPGKGPSQSFPSTSANPAPVEIPVRKNRRKIIVRQPINSSPEDSKLSKVGSAEESAKVVGTTLRPAWDNQEAVYDIALKYCLEIAPEHSLWGLGRIIDMLNPLGRFHLQAYFKGMIQKKWQKNPILTLNQALILCVISGVESLPIIRKQMTRILQDQVDYVSQ